MNPGGISRSSIGITWGHGWMTLLAKHTKLIILCLDPCQEIDISYHKLSQNDHFVFSCLVFFVLSFQIIGSPPGRSIAPMGWGARGVGELRCSRSRRTGRQACQVGLEGVSCSSCYNVGREGVPVTYGPMGYKVL